jgi:Tol biopolymer transport system component
MTAIIREDPEPLPSTVPAQLRWIVARLLAKEPAERYDSTRDLYRELRQLRDGLSETASASAIPSVTASSPRTESRRKLIAVGLTALVLGGLALWTLRPAAGTGRYRFTPMEVSWENPAAAVWSPDGKAFVYSAGAVGQRRVFLRYLNSPAATPLTVATTAWIPVGWTPDSRRVFVIGPNPQGSAPVRALLSVPVVGGGPEFLMPVNASPVVATVSPDGKTFALLSKAENGRYAVYTAAPPGSPLKRYAPAPFESTTIFAGASLRFSPDGQWLTLLLTVPGERQAWRLPYPPGQTAPRRFLNDLRSWGAPPQIAWFPDGRTGVLSGVAEEGQPSRLWIAGVRSGARRQLTSGTSAAGEISPAISPDGSKILFVQSRADYMILSASLSDASVERVISSEMPTSTPAWALRQEKFVYASTRNGSPAIWMRAEGWDRPIVTAAAFPPGSTTALNAPTLSPGADRVAYVRSDRDSGPANWISSVSGGPPVRLTNLKENEYGGSWSPDGNRFVYVGYRNGAHSLMVVKTSGEVTPAVLLENYSRPAGVSDGLPQWSPDGKWISFLDHPNGLNADGVRTLISADGKTLRRFGEPKAEAVTFSSDSQRLYGIRVEQDHNYLFSIDIVTGQEKIVGEISKDFTPRSNISPGLRLSLSPDGKSVLFPSLRQTNSLWMLEGFDPPGWAMELREMLPW